MNEIELAELLKYSSPNELWVITWNNMLQKIFCPFEVLVLQDIGELVKGQIVFVEEVKVTLDLKTVFIIYQSAYYFYHFEILVE